MAGKRFKEISEAYSKTRNLIKEFENENNALVSSNDLNKIFANVIKYDDFLNGNIKSASAFSIPLKNRLLGDLTNIENRVVEIIQKKIVDENIENNIKNFLKELEEIMNSLGYELFKVPVGDKYDYSDIGLMSSNIKNIDDKKIAEAINNSLPVYVVASDFGCKKKNNGMVVVKSAVTLSEDPSHSNTVNQEEAQKSE